MKIEALDTNESMFGMPTSGTWTLSFLPASLLAVAPDPARFRATVLSQLGRISRVDVKFAVIHD